MPKEHTPHRPLSKIAVDIREGWICSWKTPADPYIKAMRHLDQITDKSGVDSGEDIVRRFLVNAATWRGDKARAIKLELNTILKTL